MRTLESDLEEYKHEEDDSSDKNSNGGVAKN